MSAHDQHIAGGIMFHALDATVSYAVRALDRAAGEIFVEKLTFGEWNAFAVRIEHATGKLLRGTGIVYAVERHQEPSLVCAHAAQAYGSRSTVDFTAKFGAR